MEPTVDTATYPGFLATLTEHQLRGAVRVALYGTEPMLQRIALYGGPDSTLSREDVLAFYFRRLSVRDLYELAYSCPDELDRAASRCEIARRGH